MTDQFINRSTIKENFTIYPNELLNDPRLNADALAMLTYLLSKPANWRLSMGDIRKRFGWGKNKGYDVLSNLISFGYVIKQSTSLVGNVQYYDYFVYDLSRPLNRERPSNRDGSRTSNRDATKELYKEPIIINNNGTSEGKKESIKEYEFYKQWLGQITSIARSGKIISGLYAKLGQQGIKKKHERDMFILNAIKSAYQQNVQGDISDYLHKIIGNVIVAHQTDVFDPILSQWKARLKSWKTDGSWLEHSWGMPPDHPLTKVPTHLLRELE